MKTSDMTTLLEQLKAQVIELENKIAEEKKDGRKNRPARPKLTREQLDERKRKRDEARAERQKYWELKSAADRNKKRYQHFLSEPVWLPLLISNQSKEEVINLIEKVIARENRTLDDEHEEMMKLYGRIASNSDDLSDEYNMLKDEVREKNKIWNKRSSIVLSLLNIKVLLAGAHRINNPYFDIVRDN